MLRERLGPLSSDAKHQVVAGGALGFYGLGWNVSYRDNGAVQISHSGAFNLGAATSVWRR